MIAITEAWLREHGACEDQVQLFNRLYPRGTKVTVKAARKACERGLDVIWAASHLMDMGQRRDFIRFTLRQRQKPLVKLFRSAGLEEHATAIEGLDWTDLGAAEAVLHDASRYAGKAARTATGEAASNFAMGVARDYAGEAARDAWVAAREEARNAARDVWEAIGEATWEGAWAAGAEAARNAGEAARDAWVAAREAARYVAVEEARAVQVEECIRILGLSEKEEV